MHAITAITRKLRSLRSESTHEKQTNGLILANGGVLTYQFALCFSTHPRKSPLPYPSSNPLPPVLASPSTPKILSRAEGEAVIETYTVEFDRKGKAERGFVVGRLGRDGDGERFLANCDEMTSRDLGGGGIEGCGKRGRVWTVEGGRNVFGFDESARL